MKRKIIAQMLIYRKIQLLIPQLSHATKQYHSGKLPVSFWVKHIALFSRTSLENVLYDKELLCNLSLSFQGWECIA